MSPTKKAAKKTAGRKAVSKRRTKSTPLIDLEPGPQPAPSRMENRRFFRQSGVICVWRH